MAAAVSKGQSAALAGLTLTAKAVHLALLYRETGRPLVIVTDGNKQAEALFALLRTFCDLLDAGVAPLLLPALDVLPGQGISAHAEILASRVAAFGKLSRGGQGITVM